MCVRVWHGPATTQIALVCLSMTVFGQAICHLCAHAVSRSRNPFFFATTDAIAGALWAPATNPRYILFCYINLIVITDNHLALAVANTSAAQMYEHRRQREQLLQSRCVVWGRKGEIVLRRGCIGMLRGQTIQELPIFFFCYSPLNCRCCCCCCLHNLRFVHKFTYVL